MRTAYNMIIYEALGTVGLFDAGQHGVDRARPADVHSRHERHREEQDRALRHRALIPADMLLTNDALYRQHLNHMIFTVPIFHRGAGRFSRHGALARCRRHARWRTTDIFSEACRCRL